jgi:hypothetical protein
MHVSMGLPRAWRPFSREGWLFEIKYDGFRAFAYVQDGRCTLTSRKGVDPVSILVWRLCSPVCSHSSR